MRKKEYIRQEGKIWEANIGSKVKVSKALKRKEGSESFLKYQERVRCEELA